LFEPDAAQALQFIIELFAPFEGKVGAGQFLTHVINFLVDNQPDIGAFALLNLPTDETANGYPRLTALCELSANMS